MYPFKMETNTIYSYYYISYLLRKRDGNLMYVSSFKKRNKLLLAVEKKIIGIIKYFQCQISKGVS